MSTKQAILVLALVTFVAYFTSFWNQFVWDDEQFIYSNAYVKTFAVDKIFTTSTTAGAGINSNYYRPLTTLSFAIDHAVWGLNPVGFHATNLIAHTLSGILVFLILRKLRSGQTTAFVVALIFLLHPIQTEAVTYINSRGDSLFAVWGLLTMYLFIQIAHWRQSSAQFFGIEFPMSRWVLVMLTAVCYMYAILSKEIGIAIGGLLFLVLLLQITQHASTEKHTLSFVKVLEKWRWSIGALVVCGVIGVSYLLARATVLNFENSFDFYQDASVYSQSIVVRLLTFTKVVAVYVRLLLVPFPLHMERSVELVTSLTSLWLWGFLIVNAVVLWVCVTLLRRSKPLALFGYLWFYIALLPVSGIIPINGILYEHWLYIPMIGFFLLLASLLKALPTQKVRLLLQYKLQLLIVLAVVMAGLTIRQNYFWSTPVRLYTYLLQYTASGRIYNNLAMAYAQEKQPELAIQMYDKALSFGDVYPQIHHNKGNLFLQQGKMSEAISAFSRALELDPTFSFSYPMLISAYVSTGNFDQAYEIIERGEKVFVANAQWALLRRQVQETEAKKSSGAEPARR